MESQKKTSQGMGHPSPLPNKAPTPPVSPVPGIVLQHSSGSAKASIGHRVLEGNTAIAHIIDDSSQARLGPHTDGPTTRSDSPGPNFGIPSTVNCSLCIRFEGAEASPLAHALCGSSQDTYKEIQSVADNYVRETYATEIGQKQVFVRYGNCKIIGRRRYRRRLPLRSHEEWGQICKAVMVYNAENTDSNPKLEILREYFSCQVKAPNEMTLKEAKRTEIHEMMKRAGDREHGKFYVPDTDLEKLLPPNVVSDIINEDRGTSMDAQRKTNLVSQVLSEGRILFAMWIYHDNPLACLDTLLGGGCNDRNLPFTKANCCHKDRRCSHKFDIFLDGQGGFLPARFDEPGTHQNIPHGVIIPIQYCPDDDKDDLAREIGLKAGTAKRVAYAEKATTKDTAYVGTGAYSTVFRVRVDPNHHALSTDKDTYFALKEFKHRPHKVSKDFEKELRILTELRKHRHPHIVTHLATWIQDETYCMLFPYAQCNLWEYMEQTTFHVCETDNMYWFLEQFLGLASALKLIHDLSSEPGPAQASGPMLQIPTQAHQGERKTGWHHDIKPENILFFWETDPPRAILRLSDWGCGKVNTLRSGSVNTASPHGTQTYEPPEVLMEGTTSRPYDVWSLGCVFLELLVWVFWDFSTVKQFASDREDRRDLTSSAKLLDDAFWQKAEATSYVLRKSVELKLDALEKAMREGGLTSINAVLELVTMMLHVRKDERITARDLEDTLSRICRWTKIKLVNPTPVAAFLDSSVPQLSLRAPGRQSPDLLPSPSAQPFGLGVPGGTTTSPTNSTPAPRSLTQNGSASKGKQSPAQSPALERHIIFGAPSKLSIRD